MCNYELVLCDTLVPNMTYNVFSGTLSLYTTTTCAIPTIPRYLSSIPTRRY